MLLLSRFRNFCVTFCAVLLTLLASFVLVEAMLRAKNASMLNYDIEMWKYANHLKKISDNTLLGHEHIPNTDATLQSIKIRTNSLGLRGPEVQLADNNSAARRILFLGSSITLGWGVEEQETLSEKIRGFFQKDGQNVAVYNAGIGNYNAERYIERFFTRLQQLQPTDIVIHAFVRDAEPLEFRESNFFLKHSQLAVTLWSAYHKITQKQGDISLVEHYQRYYDPNSESYQNMQRSYHRLAVYAKEKGIRVYFAMTPDIHNLQNYPLNFAHAAMKSIAKENGFIYVDLLPTFSGRDAKSIWAMPGDPHPNALGHTLMAEAIYPILKLK